MATAFIRTFKNPGGTSSPSDIARLVLKAIQSKKPKTRYVANNAKLALFLRKILSDRMFDRVIYQMFKIK
jgi:hypothetical protein